MYFNFYKNLTNYFFEETNAGTTAMIAETIEKTPPKIAPTARDFVISIVPKIDDDATKFVNAPVQKKNIPATTSKIAMM